MAEKLPAVPKFSRNITVDYFEEDETRFRITSHIVDHEHDITVNFIISIPDMVVRDADVNFVRYPVPACLKICGDRMRDPIGLSLNNILESKQRLADAYLWDGCNHVYSLATASLAPFVFFYYGDLVARGKMDLEDWKKKVATDYKGNCITG